MTSRQQHWQGMNWIRQERRLAIYLRDGLACVWCGASVEQDTVLSLDHLQPHCKGGSNLATNLVTACKRCNDSRGARSLRAFAKSVVSYLGLRRPEQAMMDILRRVQGAVKRPLPLEEAKQLIARRGSVARVLASQRR